jgi:hypothetical protein
VNPGAVEIEDERDATRPPDEPLGPPGSWKRRDWEELKRYIRLLADRLGLRDWEFILLHETTADNEEADAMMSVHPVDGQKRATLRLCAEFRELPLSKVRSSVVHELLHCQHRDATDIIRLTLPRSFGGVAYEVLWENFRQAIELMVDGIASAIAEHYPLIEWPARKTKRRKP